MNPRRRTLGVFFALPLTLTASGGAALAADSTSHGRSTKFAVSGTTLNLGSRVWTQTGGKGSGDYPVKVFAAGTSTVKGGSVRGTYPSSWTWGQLKPGWHYNGAAFNVRASSARVLTFDGQRMKNIVVDGYRVSGAPARLIIRNNRAEAIRDDFVSYPNGSGRPNELYLENNLVETKTFLSWRHTSTSDTDGGRFRLVVRGNLVHLKPQAGAGRCALVRGDGKVAGKLFKFDRYQGDPRLVTVENNVFLIEEGGRDECTLPWLKGRYANNTIVYTGPANLRGRYLGAVPAGVRVTSDRSVWSRAVARWTVRH